MAFLIDGMAKARRSKSRALLLVLLMVGSVVAGAGVQTALSADGGDGTNAQTNDSSSHTISSCTNIEESGVYELTQDLEDCYIDINTSDVTLVGNGHTLEGTGLHQFEGVTVHSPGVDNLTVRDIHLGGFNASGSNDVVLANATVNGSVFYRASQAVVRDSTLRGAPGDRREAIDAGDGGNVSVENTTIDGYQNGVQVTGGTVTVTDSVIRNTQSGIAASTSTVRVENTTLTENTNGAYLIREVDSTFTNSIITDNQYGIHEHLTQPVEIHQSVIANNRVGISGPANATNNYWGAPDGPSSVHANGTKAPDPYADPVTGALANGSGDGVTGEENETDVHFDPYLSSPPGERFDREDFNESGPDRTIESCDGVREIEEIGVYELTGDCDIDINTSEVTLNGNGHTADIDLLRNRDNVTVRDLHLDGFSTYRNNDIVLENVTADHGVTYDFSNGAIRNSTLHNSSEDSIGLGVYYGSVSVRNTTIDGYAYGLNLWDGAIVTLTDSVVRNSTEYGIFGDLDSIARVKNSTLTENRYAAYFQQGTEGTFTNSTITDNERGIYQRGGGQTEAHDNVIANNTVGISGSANATNNYWGASDGPSSVYYNGTETAEPYADPMTGALANGSGNGITGYENEADARFDPWLAVPALSDEFAGPPQDLDDDGLYEDVNGDGDVNVGDAQALFAFEDSATVQEHAALFDFNDDGAVDVGDAQALFARVTGGNC